MEIYCIKNTVNGKCYVGKTTRTFKYRYGSKWWKSTHNTILKKAVNKYGLESFEIIILEIIDNKKELSDREIHWISELETINPKGYNLNSGGGWLHNHA